MGPLCWSRGGAVAFTVARAATVVARFDDEMARAITPDRVPRPEVLAAEIAVDTRTTEGSGHDTVEFAAAPERDGGRFRAKVRQDAGEDLVALLPVAARHVKAD